MRVKISVNPTLDIETLIWTNEGEFWIDESELPIRLDRAAANAAKKAAGTAGETAATGASNAAFEHASLTPAYQRWMNATHGFNPEQTNELLNFAGAGAGGANATSAGQIASEAANTRNTAGFTPALQQAARDRQQTMANANLNVGMQDVMGAKQLNQEGAAGEAGLFNADQNAMLKSMGQQNEDINTQLEAGKSGWFQNLTNGINAGANLIGAIKGHK